MKSLQQKDYNNNDHPQQQQQAATATAATIENNSSLNNIMIATSPNVINTEKNSSILDAIHHDESLISSSSSSSSFPYTALLISTSIVGTVMIFTLPFIVLPFLRGQSLPYMATPQHKIQRALHFIQQQQQQQQHRNREMGSTMKMKRQFLDLGSGDGETIYQALQLRSHSDDDNNSKQHYYYYSKCIGIELNTTLFIWSYWRRILFWTRSEQLRSQFLCRNMFQLLQHPMDAKIIRQSNTILMFGIPSLMIPLSQLLVQHQCQPGTYILCYRFPLPISNNQEHESSTLLPAKLIYDQEEMRIYECIGTSTIVDTSSNIDRVKNKETT